MFKFESTGFILFLLLLILNGISFSQSPFEFKTELEFSLIGSGAAISILDLKLIGERQPVTSEDLKNLSKQNINAFDRAAADNWSATSREISTYLLVATAVSPLFLFSSGKVQDDAAAFSTMYLQNFIFSHALPHFAKGIVTRYRPFVYNDDAPDEVKLNREATFSFFSAHSTLAFSSAVFLANVHSKYYPDSDWKWAVWASAMLAASTVAYLVYISGYHFPSDLILGAIVGSAIAYLIPELHKKDEEKFSSGIAPAQFKNLFSIRLTL